MALPSRVLGWRLRLGLGVLTLQACAVAAAALCAARLATAAVGLVTDPDADTELDDLALARIDVGIVVGLRDTGRGQDKGACEYRETTD
ncbi:hypothetical protein ACWCQZ_49100 [Streptomyces sp. NPDC002285]